MSDRREGGCLCGGLRYALTGKPLTTVACHCSDCQRQSGGAFGLTMVVRRGDFAWTRGAPKKFVTTADSGTVKDCFICGDCGVRILNALSRMPETFNLKPGTLDDTSEVAPVMHTWVSRKQPWVPIPDGVAQFEQNPGTKRVDRAAE